MSEVVGKKLVNYFGKFEEKYKALEVIDIQWYKDNCGVLANCKRANVKDVNGEYSEEWYRARMVWALVESGLYPNDLICVEFAIPKGSESAKSLNPDIVVFKTNKWCEHYEKWDKTSAVPQALRKEFLVFWEAKNNPLKVESAVTKQLAEAMTSYIGNQVFGVYFDNENDILIFRKIKTNEIKRYYVHKIIEGTEIEKLNLTNRDSLSTLPTFEQFKTNIELIQDVSKLNFESNQPIDEDDFKNLLEDINRLQDRLNVSHLQDLIVEFLTLKVTDEKEVMRKKKKHFEFYIKEDEKTPDNFGNQSFRLRIENLYKKAKTEYNSIFVNREFVYQDMGRGFLKPIHPDDEKLLIVLIGVFQTKTILNTDNISFNQIIFNNFGNNIEKAKEKQFFTPVNIVKAIIKMINPQKDETICDPCSGICDFLAMAFKHVYGGNVSNLPAADKFYGFDKDNKILKLAELNLVLNGDGNANIKIMDSITQKLLEDGNYKDINFNIANYSKETWNNINDERKNPLRYKIITTNPPFGKNRDLKTGRKGQWDVPQNTIQLYETWKVSGKPLSIDMGIIFLENAYKLLEEGGRMAIVLSNSIANTSEWLEVRKWFISKMRIVALFDLPENTFGETTVATTVFIAYKPKQDEKHILDEDYEVFIKEVEEVGYTVQTIGRIVMLRPVFKINDITFEREKDDKGNNIILSDLPNLVSEFHNWLENNKYKYSHIYNAFSGSNYKLWED